MAWIRVMPLADLPVDEARFDVATGDVLRCPAPVGIEVFTARVVDGWVEASLED